MALVALASPQMASPQMASPQMASSWSSALTSKRNSRLDQRSVRRAAHAQHGARERRTPAARALHACPPRPADWTRASLGRRTPWFCATSPTCPRQARSTCARRATWARASRSMCAPAASTLRLSLPPRALTDTTDDRTRLETRAVRRKPSCRRTWRAGSPPSSWVSARTRTKPARWCARAALSRRATSEADTHAHTRTRTYTHAHTRTHARTTHDANRAARAMHARARGHKSSHAHTPSPPLHLRVPTSCVRRWALWVAWVAWGSTAWAAAAWVARVSRAAWSPCTTSSPTPFCWRRSSRTRLSNPCSRCARP